MSDNTNDHYDQAYDLGYRDALKEIILFITELMGKSHES